MPRPKNKRYKSLDDGDCDILKISTENDTELAVDEDSDILVEKSDEDENIQVEKTTEDNVTLSELVPNLPPRRVWSDGVKLRFKTGDLVVKKGEKNKDNVLKVIGPGVKPDTYSVKNSGSDSIWYIPVSAIKRAPPKSKWISYLDVLKKNDPYEQYKLRLQKPKKKKK